MGKNNFSKLLWGKQSIVFLSYYVKKKNNFSELLFEKKNFSDLLGVKINFAEL